MHWCILIETNILYLHVLANWYSRLSVNAKYVAFQTFSDVQIKDSEWAVIKNEQKFVVTVVVLHILKSEISILSYIVDNNLINIVINNSKHTAQLYFKVFY